MADFQDIRLVELDDQASKPSGKGELVDLVLRLSAVPPHFWSAMFNVAWKNQFIMTKRDAYASGDIITVTCMPDELQGQIDVMKGVIGRVNAAYAAELGKAESTANEIRAKEAAEAIALEDLKGKLNFD